MRGDVLPTLPQIVPHDHIVEKRKLDDSYVALVKYQTSFKKKCRWFPASS